MLNIVFRSLLMALITGCMLMVGCSGTREMIYKDSRLVPLLEIPAGLETPQYSDVMKIPQRQSNMAQDSMTTEQTELLERPPIILQEKL